jgi:hypothetical protein|nr:MAG TPA: hypothetical protein [Caudoviricetes sp.]
MSEKVKRTERGWCGHFIGSTDCLYHRNTLLKYGEQKVVVSTVGRYMPIAQRQEYWKHGKVAFDTVGHNRYFETMAFLADDSQYHDVDVTKRIGFSSNWELDKPDMEMEADAMHDAVCDEIAEDMVNGTLCINDYENLC